MCSAVISSNAVKWRLTESWYFDFMIWKDIKFACDICVGLKEYLGKICARNCDGQNSPLLVLRSTSKSRPNNIRGENVRPSVRTSVRPSTKSFFDLNEIWYVGRGRWVMHDDMPYGRIQGQGQGHHEPFKVWIPSIFKTYLLRHLQSELASDH